MNRRSLLALALVLPATFALAADGNFDKTLTVNAAPAVTISTGAGYVHVYNGADNQIHITGHVHASQGLFGSDADADARVKQIIASPPITQSGDTITIGTPHSDPGIFHNIAIDYDVTTPRASTLKAHTGSGSMEIGGISGTVTADSGSGSIHVDNIGPNCRINTGSGRIQATNVHGGATLQTGSGSMELTVSAPGDVKAQTGSGSIHIDGIAGALRAGTGSGSIEVAGNPTDEWRVGTGSGSIRLHLAPNSHFTLNAETGSGSIHVNQPILTQGDMNKHRITGAVNGGGPTLRASTGSGSITLE